MFPSVPVRPAHQPARRRPGDRPGGTPPATALDPDAIDRAARLFRAIGDEARLRLLARLADGPSGVTELAAAEGSQVSTMSQRLRVLRTEHLLVRRREGRHIMYALADDHVIEIVRAALAHVVESASGRRQPRLTAAHSRESSSS